MIWMEKICISLLNFLIFLDFIRFTILFFCSACCFSELTIFNSNHSKHWEIESRGGISFCWRFSRIIDVNTVFSDQVRSNPGFY